jgi:ABC-2 type transport system permease protein
MSALGIILRYRARAARNRLRQIRNESLLKTVVVVVAGGGLWIGLFVGALRSFAFLQRFPDLREDIVYSGVALLFMALTVLLIFSGAVMSLGSLFRNDEAAFFMSKPVPAGSVYAYKTFDGLVFSSWAFLVMGLPPLLAYGVDVGAPVTYYLGLPLFLVPFTLMTASVGTFIGLVITGLLPRQRGRIVIYAGTAILIVAAVFALKTLATGSEGLPLEEWKDNVLGQLHFLRSRRLPHSWLTRGILMLAVGRLSDAVVPWLAATTTGVLAFLLGDFVARRTYARAYSSAASGSGRKRYGRDVVARAARALARPAGRISALFVAKDVRVFLRDPAQWSQVLIFFGLLGIYILNLRNLRYSLPEGFWQHLVSTLNLGAASLTLGTLTTRFIFPQVSLEGRRFWVLGLAPVRRREILYGKFAFSLGGTFLIAETLIIFSNAMLRMPAGVFIVHMIAAALICTGLTGLAVGLGAAFPDYRQTNPARIVSGFGGTLTLILSVVFITMVVGAVGVLSYMRLVSASIGPRAFVRWGAVTVGFACVSTALAAGLPLMYGARALDRAEF